MSVLKQDKGFALQFCIAKPSEQLGSAQFYYVFGPFLLHCKPSDSALQKQASKAHGICSKLLQIDEKQGKEKL